MFNDYLCLILINAIALRLVEYVCFVNCAMFFTSVKSINFSCKAVSSCLFEL